MFIALCIYSATFSFPVSSKNTIHSEFSDIREITIVSSDDRKYVGDKSLKN